MIGTHGLAYQIMTESEVKTAVKILSLLHTTCSTSSTDSCGSRSNLAQPSG